MSTSSRDFQLAMAKLIASPKLCAEVISDDRKFFADFDLTEKDKRRLNAVLRQKGISACCSLYRMNRVTPVYMQLGNTSAILGDDLIPLLEKFWVYMSDTTLQYKEEVLEFGKFLRQQIDAGEVTQAFLKEVLLLELTINELSYIPEGEYRVVTFNYDILSILQAANAGTLTTEPIPKTFCRYKLYMKNFEIQMDEM